MSYDHVSVFDSDDLPLDVRVFINYPVDFSRNCAQFETASVGNFDGDSPKKPLSGFSAEDLKNGQIFLKHYGDILKCDLELIAEDSSGAQSRIVKISIESYAVNLKLLRNTGLRSFPFGHVTIRKENLSFALDSWNMETQIYYVIVKNPNVAVLEVKHGNQWKNVSIFTQNDIDQNMVRFTVIKKNIAEDTDSFKFCVNTEPRIRSEIHDFQVQFIKPEFQLHTSLFLLNNTVNRTISRHHLFAWVPNVEPLHASDVVYKIYKSPSYGFLYRIMDSNTGRTRKLGVNSNFTQSDLDMDLIFYKLRKLHPTVTSDEFTFRLSIHSYESDTYKFFATSLPNVDDDDTKLADQILKVREGGSASIANGTFHLGAMHNEMLTFLIIKPPENGQLFKIQPQSPRLILGLGQSFNLIDVQSNFIFYKHDDSETVNDSVKFIVQSQSEKVRETFELKIDIQLENDNLPIQELSTIGKLFQIVKNGQRTVTNRFLKYSDLDADFDDQFLTYEFDQRVADVEFYHMSNMRRKVYNFTQKNIDDQVIIYKHAGYANYFRLLYTVSDGKHKVHGQMAVNASNPYVRVVVPKDFFISTNGTFQINEQNLTVDTNQDLRNEEISFKLRKQTKHVKLVKDQLFVTEFTFAQLLGGHLAVTLVNNLDLETPKFNKFAFYENLHVVVSAGDLTTDAKIKVHVIAEENREESFHTVRAGKNLTVENGGYSILSAENFEIIDSTERIPADQIKFIVIGPPIYGNLLTFDTNAMSGYLERPDYSLQVFTLSDVNRGSLRYLHDPRKSSVDSQLPLLDRLVLQFMINDEKREKFTLPVIIISRKLSMDVKNLTTVRGHRICLTGDSLWIKENLNEIQEELNPEMLNFRIDQKPSYGRIELMDDGQVENFTLRHVLDRRICYRNFDVVDSMQQDLFKISAHYSVAKKYRTSDQLAIHVNIVKDNIKGTDNLVFGKAENLEHTFIRQANKLGENEKNLKK
uniref:Chondroitin sulfate proteoglycan 4 n=1 Tax=Romanomermis culicivorax TaxID=13658 RepID=A0A915IKZ1_ROMCU